MVVSGCCAERTCHPTQPCLLMKKVRSQGHGAPGNWQRWVLQCACDSNKPLSTVTADNGSPARPGPGWRLLLFVLLPTWPQPPAAAGHPQHTQHVRHPAPAAAVTARHHTFIHHDASRYLRYAVDRLSLVGSAVWWSQKSCSSNNTQQVALTACLVPCFQGYLLEVSDLVLGVCQLLGEGVQLLLHLLALSCLLLQHSIQFARHLQQWHSSKRTPRPIMNQRCSKPLPATKKCSLQV